MMNRNMLTAEENAIVSRISGKSDAAVRRNLLRMLPILPVSEVEPALSAIAKLTSGEKHQPVRKAAHLLSEKVLEKTTLIRAHYALSSSMQTVCCLA